MRLGKSLKQNKITASFDVIVIGSGIGGLACAALLGKHAGKKVLVLERHYTAGGFTHTFTRKGFEWDVGVHYIGEVTHPKAQLRRVFDDISDGNIEWEDMGEVYDTIVIGDDRYDLVKGRDNFKRKLKEY
ncbi:MAG: NAD(P)/FAD-dependent oxidoreductase [Kofleriaceae bacterium]|nr:NAD(P)/FAD-dependent oxidoreductase [Kofleriaceae bacterium]